MDAPRYTTNASVYSDLQVDYIKDYIVKLSENFYSSTKTSDYELIRQVGTYDYEPRDKHRRPKDFIDIHKLGIT